MVKADFITETWWNDDRRQRVATMMDPDYEKWWAHGKDPWRDRTWMIRTGGWFIWDRARGPNWTFTAACGQGGRGPAYNGLAAHREWIGTHENTHIIDIKMTGNIWPQLVKRLRALTHTHQDGIDNFYEIRIFHRITFPNFGTVFFIKIISK